MANKFYGEYRTPESHPLSKRLKDIRRWFYESPTLQKLYLFTLGGLFLTAVSATVNDIASSSISLGTITSWIAIGVSLPLAMKWSDKEPSSEAAP